MLHVGVMRAEEDNKAQIVPKKIAIIDAGSTGSRIYVYEKNSSNGHADVKELFRYSPDKDNEPNILSKVNPKEPEESDVINYIKNVTEKYAAEGKANEIIPLYILATAGMRQADQDQADKLFQIFNSLINGSNDKNVINGFKLTYANTIFGYQEGAYAWINVCQEHKDLDDSKIGIIEIGGASIQVAYKNEEKDCEDCIKHCKYNFIYSKSYDNGLTKEYESIANRTKDIKTYTSPIEDYSKKASGKKFFCLGKSNVYLEQNINAQEIEKLKNKEGLNEDETKKIIFYEIIKASGIDNPEKYDASWTKGAAFDILVNEKNPDEYQHLQMKKEE